MSDVIANGLLSVGNRDEGGIVPLRAGGGGRASPPLIGNRGGGGIVSVGAGDGGASPQVSPLHVRKSQHKVLAPQESRLDWDGR